MSGLICTLHVAHKSQVAGFTLYLYFDDYLKVKYSEAMEARALEACLTYLIEEEGLDITVLGVYVMRNLLPDCSHCEYLCT